MTKRLTVQDAKAHLSEVLRRARAGEPQRIGVRDGCVVVSERACWAERSGADLGAWLVASAPRGAPLDQASRGSHRIDPFGQAQTGGDHDADAVADASPTR